MRAMVVKNWGEAFVLEERPDPQPAPGEAVMKLSLIHISEPTRPY